MTNHRNFPLVTSDQHNPFVMGNAGDPLVSTPGLGLRSLRDGLTGPGARSV